MRRSARTLTVVALLSLLVAGCGGGASGLTTTTRTSASQGKNDFTTGFLAFEAATNELGNEITPLERAVTASKEAPRS